ncbi:hypothetical protein [Cerasicoccus arenae]|nr:hypothetical protein [Cerasicoccus arenae]MBK1859378.1 hypothetical protein [Cerasicoccus arenae]
MKPLAVLLILLASMLVGCESTTTSVNDGFGMDFSETGDADQAKVID